MRSLLAPAQPDEELFSSNLLRPLPAGASTDAPGYPLPPDMDQMSSHLASPQRVMLTTIRDVYETAMKNLPTSMKEPMKDRPVSMKTPIRFHESPTGDRDTIPESNLTDGGTA